MILMFLSSSTSTSSAISTLKPKSILSSSGSAFVV